MLALITRKFARVAVVIAAMSAFAASSQAVITFSNVTITGTPQLVAGATFNTSTFDIDFTTPNAIVGDFQPLRSGAFTITYEATSDTAMMRTA